MAQLRDGSRTSAHAKRKVYLIQDPYYDDALEFIRTIGLSFGLKAVCFYTDSRARFNGERDEPILTSDLVEAAFDVGTGDLEEFAAEVARRYDVVAVIPFGETILDRAIVLNELLGLDWNPAATMARFRDKYSLKQHVQSTAPHVRVPVGRTVSSLDEVWSGEVPKKFVLKPNDGGGNFAIGVFRDDERDAVAAHLAAYPDQTTWVLEEFIEGREFQIPGQVRTDGQIVVLGVFEYVRTEVNGYPTVYAAERQLGTDHPLFEPIATYTRELMAATGLRRCPFHLEVKVDDDGPCLIDLGARYGSGGQGREVSRLHPNRPDAYRIAAQDYLWPNDFAPEPVDWTYYDSVRMVLVYGISTADELIQTLSGVDEVEAMPEFVRWVGKPYVGQRVTETKELLSAPYSVDLLHTGDDDYSDELIARVRDAIRWNESPRPIDKLRANALDFTHRAVPKGRWLAQTLAQTLTGRR